MVLTKQLTNLNCELVHVCGLIFLLYRVVDYKHFNDEPHFLLLSLQKKNFNNINAELIYVLSQTSINDQFFCCNFLFFLLSPLDFKWQII